MESKACIFCHETFTPNKYSPKQTTCSNPECQKRRQLESMKQWRQSHPNYFKFDETKPAEWIQKQRERSKLWRQSNPDKVRAYRQVHLNDYRQYMREYMRQYRQNKKSGDEPTPHTTPANQTSNLEAQDQNSTGI